MTPDTPIYAVYDSLDDVWYTISPDGFKDLVLQSVEGDDDE